MGAVLSAIKLAALVNDARLDVGATVSSCTPRNTSLWLRQQHGMQSKVMISIDLTI
jgi:hypothetical protein